MEWCPPTFFWNIEEKMFSLINVFTRFLMTFSICFQLAVVASCDPRIFSSQFSVSATCFFLLFGVNFKKNSTCKFCLPRFPFLHPVFFLVSFINYWFFFDLRPQLSKRRIAMLMVWCYLCKSKIVNLRPPRVDILKSNWPSAKSPGVWSRPCGARQLVVGSGIKQPRSPPISAR